MFATDPFARSVSTEAFDHEEIQLFNPMWAPSAQWGRVLRFNGPKMHQENMPQGQVNAYLADGLQMRVGVPHRGGKLAFHAFNEGFSAMVSASAFWNPAKSVFVIPEASDLYEIDWALDSAGFTAVKGWQAKGTQPGMAGIYPWSLAAYVEAASLLRPSWWSAPDLCNEMQVAANPDEVRHRINVTATLLEGTLQIIYEWQNELARTCNSTVVQDLVRPPVPIIQGWTRDSYLYSLDLTMEVWRRWEPWLASPALMGLGSVCRRDTSHPEHGLYAILQALDGKLPSGTRLHLFGVKGSSLAQVKKLPWIASTDSMAWDFSARINARKSGQSNTMDHRASEMTRWMQSASKRVAVKLGDQQELCLLA